MKPMDSLASRACVVIGGDMIGRDMAPWSRPPADAGQSGRYSAICRPISMSGARSFFYAIITLPIPWPILLWTKPCAHLDRPQGGSAEPLQPAQPGNDMPLKDSVNHCPAKDESSDPPS